MIVSFSNQIGIKNKTTTAKFSRHCECILSYHYTFLDSIEQSIQQVLFSQKDKIELFVLAIYVSNWFRNTNVNN